MSKRVVIPGALLLIATIVGIAIAAGPPPGWPNPPSNFLPPGTYHVPVLNPPLSPPGQPTILDIGGGGGAGSTVFRPLGASPLFPVNPPAGYEDDWGNMWYFLPDGTVWVLDWNGVWHDGTYHQI